MAALNIEKSSCLSENGGLGGIVNCIFSGDYTGRRATLSSDSIVITSFLETRALGFRVQPQDFKGLGIRFIGV